MNKYIFLTFLVLILLPFKSFWNNDLNFNDSTKTIRELRENIEELDRTKDELYIRSMDFSPDVVLRGYFRDDLTRQDLEILKSVIDDYNFNRRILEKDLNSLSKSLVDTSIIRKNLLEEKKELYKKMTPFIKISHYDDYINYIKSDTIIYSEKTEIDSSIIKKKEMINNKVWAIENRIREHRSYLEDNLRSIVNERLDERISIIASNPWFINLENNRKIEILNAALEKTNLEINKLAVSEWFMNNSVLQRIEIYNITYRKLEEFRNSFIQKN